MRASSVAACLSLALLRSAPAGAQAIVGKVTDSAGTPIAFVRVMVRPAGDASDTALRAAVTNERGEFRVLVTGGGQYDVSARRIGFRAELSRRASVPASGDVRVDIALAALPLSLTTVQVRAPRCLPLDSPDQSDDVRAWVASAEDMMLARRAIERDYSYTVREVLASGGHGVKGEVRRRDTTYVQTIDSKRPPVSDQTWGLSFYVGSAGKVTVRFPTEARLLSAGFIKLLCFDDAIEADSTGARLITFKQVESDTGVFSTDVLIRGTFALDSVSGAYSKLSYEIPPFVSSYQQSGTMTYETVLIDGKPFPMLQSRVEHRYDIPRSRDARPREVQHLEYRFTFSAFVRRPPP